MMGGEELAKALERRRNSRVKIHLEADLYTQDQVLLACQTQDVSLKGLSILTDKPLPIGQPCKVALWLCGVEPELVLSLEARVVRNHAQGVGLEISAVHGLDCYHHLVNLLLYNSEEPEKILQETSRRMELPSVNGKGPKLPWVNGQGAGSG